MCLCVISLFCCSDNTTGKTYIMMEARLVALFKSESEYTVLDKWVHWTCGMMKWLEQQCVALALARRSGDKCQKTCTPLILSAHFLLGEIKCQLAEIHFQEAEMFASLKETVMLLSIHFTPFVICYLILLCAQFPTSVRCSAASSGDKKWFATWNKWSSWLSRGRRGILKTDGLPFHVGFLPTHPIYWINEPAARPVRWQTCWAARKTYILHQDQQPHIILKFLYYFKCKFPQPISELTRNEKSLRSPFLHLLVPLFRKWKRALCDVWSIFCYLTYRIYF